MIVPFALKYLLKAAKLALRLLHNNSTQLDRLNILSLFSCRNNNAQLIMENQIYGAWIDEAGCLGL